MKNYYCLLTLSVIPPRVSNDCIDHVYHSLMSQLNQEHAEIRLSAFQIVSELFSRSHHFRTLLVDNFQVLASCRHERRHVDHLGHFFYTMHKTAAPNCLSSLLVFPLHFSPYLS